MKTTMNYDVDAMMESTKVKRKELNRKDVKNYIKSLEQEINRWAKVYGLPKLSLEQTAKRAFHKDDQIFRAVHEHGGFFSEAVETAMELIARIVIGKERGIALIGLTQISKLAVQVLTATLTPLYMREMYGGETFPVFYAMTPGDNGLVRQFRTKSQDLQYIIDDATIGNGKHHVRSWHHISNLHVQSMLSKNPTALRLFDNLNTDACFPCGIFAPIRRNYITLLKAVAKGCSESGSPLIILQDECDYGSKDDSVADKMIKQDFDSDQVAMQRELEEVENSIEELYHSDHHNALHIIRTSATNYTWNKISGVPTVKVRVGEGFTGINVDPSDPSKPYDEHADITPPEIWSDREFADWVNDKCEENIELDVKKYREALQGGDNRFARRFERRLARWIELLLIEKDDRNSKGILARIIVNNSIMSDMISRLENLLPREICLIRHFNGGKDTLPTVESNIALHMERFPHAEKYVVFVTNSCRMGQNVPKDCAYGIDLTAQTHISTILQGTIGRLCGYNKRPFIVVPEHVADRVDKYQRFIPLSGYSSTAKVLTDKVSFPFERGDHPVADQMMDVLQELLDDWGCFGKSKDKCLNWLFKPAYKALNEHVMEQTGKPIDNPKEWFTTQREYVANDPLRDGGGKLQLQPIVQTTGKDKKVMRLLFRFDRKFTEGHKSKKIVRRNESGVDFRLDRKREEAMA